MRRRTLLHVGVATGTLLALAGAGLALTRAGLRNGRLTDAGREVFHAVARAVLDGSLPIDPAMQAKALQGQLTRLDITIGGFPPALQGELAELTALLAHAAGRLILTGLHTDWPLASLSQVQTMMQGLRESKLAVRQQIYHALRDLTQAAYFADPATWPAMGYAGPLAV
ncbi:MAG: hypothetical protein H7Z19_06530 [Chitinophagaceae bacterium]|nr:hypothetical protein [Rubrivivax sp.]